MANMTNTANTANTAKSAAAPELWLSVTIGDSDDSVPEQRCSGRGVTGPRGGRDLLERIIAAGVEDWGVTGVSLCNIYGTRARKDAGGRWLRDGAGRLVKEQMSIAAKMDAREDGVTWCEYWRGPADEPGTLAWFAARLRAKGKRCNVYTGMFTLESREARQALSGATQARREAAVLLRCLGLEKNGRRHVEGWLSDLVDAGVEITVDSVIGDGPDPENYYAMVVLRRLMALGVTVSAEGWPRASAIERLRVPTHITSQLHHAMLGDERAGGAGQWREFIESEDRLRACLPRRLREFAGADPVVRWGAVPGEGDPERGMAWGDLVRRGGKDGPRGSGWWKGVVEGWRTGAGGVRFGAMIPGMPFVEAGVDPGAE